MNSEIPPSILSVASAASQEEFRPAELLKGIAGLLLQGIEGAAIAAPRNHIAFDRFIGADFNSAKNALKREQPHLEVEKEEVHWPLEVLALHRLLQTVLPLGNKRIVAYTSGNVIVGFGSRSLSTLPNDVMTPERTEGRTHRGRNP